MQELYKEIANKILEVKKLQMTCKQQLDGKFSAMVMEELEGCNLSLKQQHDMLEESILNGTSETQTDALVPPARKALDAAEAVLEFCSGRLQRAAT